MLTVSTQYMRVREFDSKCIEIRSSHEVIRHIKMSAEGQTLNFYDAEGPKPGRAYILDNRYFDIQVRKEGNFPDVDRLESTFENFGMTVSCLNQGTHDEIKVLMKEISRYDFRTSSCLLMVIITNKIENDTFSARWGNYSFDKEVMRRIGQNRTLKAKPKLFFVMSQGGYTNEWPSELLDEMFLMNFCNGGVRDISIQHAIVSPFCYLLDLHGQKECITRIAEYTKKRIAALQKIEDDFPQLAISSTLNKEFIFGDYINNSGYNSNLSAISDESSSSEEEVVGIEELEPGRVYIINHKTFIDPNFKERDGSDVDARRLEEVFRKYNMTVKCIDDGTLEDVKTVTNEISEFNFEKSSCLVLVIMSYCGKLDSISAKDGVYSLIKDTIPTILQNKSLMTKPKMIILESTDCLNEHRISIEGPQTEEIFLAKSCATATMTYRNCAEKGSIFIQTFCKHLELSGSKKCIEEIYDDTLDNMRLSAYHISKKNTTLLGYNFGNFAKKRDRNNFKSEGVKPGRAFIINHRKFNDVTNPERKGSEHDIKSLQRSFKRFGMTIDSTILDGTISEVEALMETIATYDFKDEAYMVLVIMSHGHECNTIYAKDGEYSLTFDVWYKILQNKSLTSKPKIVIVQACKGYVDPTQHIEKPVKRPTTTPAQMLQFNSCVEGYVSYLDVFTGSIFIQTLCQYLRQYGMVEDIVKICNRVVGFVRKDFSDSQIPMIHANMDKGLVLGDYIKNRRILRKNKNR